MASDIEAIVAADRGAQRELDALTIRLASRAREEAERQARDCAAADTAARARLDAETAALKREGEASLAATRTARAIEREARRARASASFDQAVAAYVAIVKGKGS